MQTYLGMGGFRADLRWDIVIVLFVCVRLYLCRGPDQIQLQSYSPVSEGFNTTKLMTISINLIALRMAKTLLSFGCSEWNRVKQRVIIYTKYLDKGMGYLWF